MSNHDAIDDGKPCPSVRDCAHGHLARSCETCEYERRIAELEEALRDAMRYVESDALQTMGVYVGSQVPRVAWERWKCLVNPARDENPEPVCADCGSDLDQDGRCQRGCGNAPPCVTTNRSATP